MECRGAFEEGGVVEEVGIDRCDTYCWHCLVFLLQMKKRNRVTVGTSQLADTGVFFVEDGFRPPAL